jgi:cation transport regulator ChaC
MAIQQRADDRWYFAYGSNLSVDQKELRTGRIRQAVRCRLPGYRFDFNKRGEHGQVYANIVVDGTSEVWGVAYLCSPAAMREMDKCEGVAAGHYERLPVEVILESGQRIEAIAYIAGAAFVCQPRAPSDDYLERIISGARHHGLPADYVERIEMLALDLEDDLPPLWLALLAAVVGATACAVAVLAGWI